MFKKVLLVLFSTNLCATEQTGPVSSVLGAGFCVYNIANLVNTGASIYANNFPDDEKKTAINKARDINEFFTAKKEFRDCLMENTKTPRNASGRPSACEDLARMFALIAGKPELDEMTENFKIAYQE